MVIEISDYYKKNGYVTAYLATNKEPRRICTLRRTDGTMTSMSYAKYLYTSHYNCEVNSNDHVDHINGDKMDDRIENLQVISGTYNRQKDHKIKKWLCVYVLCVAKNFYLIRETSRHVQTLVVVESVVVLNHTGNNHIIPEDHRFKPCMAHTTRTAEICALNISSKSWQAYFKVFSLHGLINMIVRAP
jgi:hypothetical protein